MNAMTSAILSHNYTFPALLILSLCMLLPVVSSKNRYWRCLLFWSLLSVQVVYLYWRFTVTVTDFQLSTAALWQYLFLITESFTVTYVCWQCVTLPISTEKDAKNTQLKPPVPTKIQDSVDLFIPTYSEPEGILTETIHAAKADQYENLKIWICDDGNRAWLRSLCALEGVNYLSRPVEEPLRTKAANLNYCIPFGSAKYITCVDADFQLLPYMTETLVEKFSDPAIGLVQAPQHFRNPDTIQNNLNGVSAWAEEQRFFFDISLPSRDAWNNALCVGSCWAVRREVIDELGGFPTDSIVEDVYFGYRVKSIGWKTTYVNEAVATGLAPIDTPSYIGQRKRWCLGAIALLRAPHGPFRAKGLTVIDRLYYFDISFYWLTHIHLVILLIAPILYGFFGLVVFQCTTEQLFLVLIPKGIFSAALFYWISQGRCMPLIIQVQKTLPVFSVIDSIFTGLFFPDSATFNVTPKEASYGNRTIHWRLAAPFIVLGCLTAASLAVTLLQTFTRFDWSDYVVFNTMLSAYSITTIFLCCLACVDKPMQKTPENICAEGSLLDTVTAVSKRVFC